MNPNPDFPAWLRAARLRLGLTCDEMAALCGVSRHTWDNWSAGNGTPNALYRMRAVDRINAMEAVEVAK